jgi:hypothetical protein
MGSGAKFEARRSRAWPWGVNHVAVKEGKRSAVRKLSTLNPAEPRLLGDDIVLCIVGLGQSWMQGGNSDRADPLATPRAEHPSYALQLDAPPLPRPGYAATVIDLHEREAGARLRERPLSGCADAFERALVSRFGRRHRLLMVTASRGGSTLRGGLIPNDGLLPGSMAYAWMLDQIGQAANLINGQGKRLVVISIIAAHGETDASSGGSGEEFAHGWRRLRRQADDDIRGLTGQTEPVLLHAYQTTGLDRRSDQSAGCTAAQIAWWQLWMSDADPLCRCVGPVYWAASNPNDFAHVTNRSLRRVGLQFGRYVFDDVLGRGRRPLRVVDLTWTDARRLRVTYPQDIVIESDDSRINVSALGPGRGFDVEWPEPASVPRIVGIEGSPQLARGVDLIFDRPPRQRAGRLLVGARPTGRGVGRDFGGRTAVRSRLPLDEDPQDGFLLHDWACVEALELPPASRL